MAVKRGAPGAPRGPLQGHARSRPLVGVVIRCVVIPSIYGGCHSILNLGAAQQSANPGWSLGAYSAILNAGGRAPGLVRKLDR